MDDTQESANILNANLDRVKKWADTWLVNFNPEKTKTMTLTNKRAFHPPLMFDNKLLDEVESHNFQIITSQVIDVNVYVINDEVFFVA